MAQSSAQSLKPLELECPFRLIARLVSSNGSIDVRCIGKDCALFSEVRFGFQNKKVVRGCSFVVSNKLWKYPLG